eukprot:TRINITY_DN5269_c0_g2_i2.p2 TRINITY_DN5269_c0_g2~~TRINITY_DN5269_c0_g2_i2.p2  ORF type:complete len:122 (-),score=8.93 TRINITY_DN5269_c0_g2_i2:176-541(-)
MMDHAGEVHTKLVFDRASQRLVGGSVMREGDGAASHVDFISLAIQMGATMDDLMAYQYATHPELAAKPSDNSYAFAVRDAGAKMGSQGRCCIVVERPVKQQNAALPIHVPDFSGRPPAATR